MSLMNNLTAENAGLLCPINDITREEFVANTSKVEGLEKEVSDLKTQIEALTEKISGIGPTIVYSIKVNCAEANTWYDTGITYTDLATGTYMVQMINNSYNVNSQFVEYASGVMSWYSNPTNSSNADEIILHRAGHARNDHVIKLRTLRQPGTGSSKMTLQISDTIAWKGTGDVTLTFRKMM